MSVLVELHNVGDATIRTEFQVLVEHVLSGRCGEWRVSIVGSRAKEDWDMKVEGPDGFEGSYHWQEARDSTSRWPSEICS
jgi:hypothetical protein